MWLPYEPPALLQAQSNGLRWHGRAALAWTSGFYSILRKYRFTEEFVSIFAIAVMR